MCPLEKSLRPGLGSAVAAAAITKANRGSISARAIALPAADRRIKCWFWQEQQEEECPKEQECPKVACGHSGVSLPITQVPLDDARFLVLKGAANSGARSML